MTLLHHLVQRTLRPASGLTPALGNPFAAFVVTFVEGLLTLTLLRFLYRAARWLLNLAPAEHPAERAARLEGFVVPEGFEPCPAPWQRQRGTLTLATSG